MSQHRGKSYTVVVGISGSEWKWTVELDGRTRSGTTRIGRQAAIREAENAIDNALAPKKRKLKPRP